MEGELKFNTIISILSSLHTALSCPLQEMIRYGVLSQVSWLETMELLLLPLAHAATFSRSPAPAFRLHPAPRSRARPPLARRKRGGGGDDAAAEPKVITIGRPGKSARRRDRKRRQQEEEAEAEAEAEADDGERDEAIPEAVTNRMMRRVGVWVGAPLALGVGFFPVFYYLKAVAKVDVPTWIPFGVSFVFFGAALAGVSYGIVSASWDPAREGSLLGWNEARRNWPVFWESLRGRSPPP